MSAPTRMQRLRGDGQPARVQDNVGATLDPLAKRVGETPIMGAPPPAWVKPDIISTSGYAQGPSTTATPLPTTSYHRDALGYVHGKVCIVTAAGAAGGVVVFNIAQGSRPIDMLPFLMSDGGGNVWDVTVRPNGDFTVEVALAAADLLTGTFTYLAEL